MPANLVRDDSDEVLSAFVEHVEKHGLDVRFREHLKVGFDLWDELFTRTLEPAGTPRAARIKQARSQKPTTYKHIRDSDFQVTPGIPDQRFHERGASQRLD